MTTNATPDILCPNCPDDRCAGYHHAVGDPCGCFLLPLACAACGHEDETHGRACACDLCPGGVCQPIDAPATLPGEDDEADAFATMNALILPDALGDGDAVEPARVLTWTQTRDDMTPADARAYAAALMAAAELAGGAA